MGKLKKVFEGNVLREGGEVPRRELLRYGLGITGQNIACGITGWILFYTNTVLGVSIGIIGTIMTICRIWDAVNDPLMGSFIDRHRFKSGEKLRPFLRYAALISGAAIALIYIMAFVLRGTTWLFGIIIFLLYFIYDMSFTVQDISMWGMTSVMTSSGEERGKLAQLGRIFATIGSFLPGLITPMMSAADAIGLPWKYLFLIIGVLFGMGGMVMSMLSHTAHERVRTPPPKKDEVKLRDNLNLLFKNKMVMLILIGSILSGFSLGVSSIYFFIFKMGFTVTLFGKYEIATTTLVFAYDLIAGVPSTLAMLFAGKIKKIFGSWKNVLIASCVFVVVARVICYFIGWQDNRIFIVLLIMAFAGLPGGLTGIAMTSLWGDSIDYMEYQTGMRGEGITFAAQIFCNKIGGAINTGVFTIMMLILHFDTEHFEDYKNGVIPTLAGAENFTNVAWELFMLGPIVGAILNLIPLLFIHYSEHQRDEITEALKLRRAAAEQGNAVTSDSTPNIDTAVNTVD